MAYKSWFNSNTCSPSLLASHIDGALADGEYELVPAGEEAEPGGDVHVNHLEAAPETIPEQEHEGKPRSIT